MYLERPSQGIVGEIQLESSWGASLSLFGETQSKLFFGDMYSKPVQGLNRSILERSSRSFLWGYVYLVAALCEDPIDLWCNPVAAFVGFCDIQLESF